ncbi:MAG TPA: class I SAM-dependent methyltransferase [Candidatus Acidoferrum sp.]|nr:class I SAM-dependent methyltransferase [Candidatus Acidoferrum sp.]
MTRYNDKQKVRQFYDRVSPYSQNLWGMHLHHGYWISGEETKEKAQIQLVEHLADLIGLGPGSKILDVGCGYGGSSIHLAKNYDADATGITISPIQVEMARKAAALDGVNAKFILMDAEKMEFDESFDVVWSVESISHYPHKEKFFASAAQCLKSGGTLAIIDWFKKEQLTQREYKKFIQPIEKGMLVELDAMEDYAVLLRTNGFHVVRDEVLSKNCSKTWDLCLDMLKNKALWRLAAENGSEFVDFLLAFRAMRAGFASGNFVYGLVIAKRI